MKFIVHSFMSEFSLKFLNINFNHLVITYTSSMSTKITFFYNAGTSVSTSSHNNLITLNNPFIFSLSLLIHKFSFHFTSRHSANTLTARWEIVIIKCIWIFFSPLTLAIWSQIQNFCFFNLTGSVSLFSMELIFPYPTIFVRVFAHIFVLFYYL